MSRDRTKPYTTKRFSFLVHVDVETDEGAEEPKPAEVKAYLEAGAFSACDEIEHGSPVNAQPCVLTIEDER